MEVYQAFWIIYRFLLPVEDHPVCNRGNSQFLCFLWSVECFVRKVIFWLLHAVRGAGRSYCQKMISLSFYFVSFCWFLVSNSTVCFFHCWCCCCCRSEYRFSHFELIITELTSWTQYIVFICDDEEGTLIQANMNLKGSNGILHHINYHIYAYFPLPNNINWHFTT